jgi:hypothetical protein
VSGPIWLLLPVVVGLSTVGYFFFFVLRRMRQPISVPMPSVPGGEGGAEDAIPRALADLLGVMVGHVPVDVISRYESIHRRMLGMVPRMGQMEGTSQDLYILRRTAEDYLPTAILPYLRLARAGADERPLPDGRTPHQVVLAQLELIDAKLAEIDDALNSNDLDRLLVHGRFLETRFAAASSGDLALKPPPS